MTAAEQFYLVAIAYSAAVVGVMVGIAGMVRLLVWLDARRIPQAISDDEIDEYRDAAILAWSNATWAEFDRAAS